MHPSTATGTCVCLVHNDNRCCYANIGASARFDIDTLNAILPDLLHAASHPIFYVEGFFIKENRYSLMKKIIELPESHANVRTAINLSAPYIIEMHPNEMQYLAEECHILFGNADDYLLLAENRGFDDIPQIMLHLIDLTATADKRMKIIVCTNGSKNVQYTYYNGDVDDPAYKRVHECHVDPVPKENIADTTGCGDAFVAGFFYAFLQNDTIKNCVRNGIKVAAQKLQSVGGSNLQIH